MLETNPSLNLPLAKSPEVWVIQPSHLVPLVSRFLENAGRNVCSRDMFIALNVPETRGIQSRLHSHTENDNVG